MKKILIFLLTILFTLSFNISVANADFAYNGLAGKHAFSFKFPNNWFAKTIGDKRQGFTPNINTEELPFEAFEFEGMSLSQVINYFIEEDVEFTGFQDEIFSTQNEDLIIKKAIFLDNIKNKKFGISIIKRGSITLAFTSPNLSSDLFPFDKNTNTIIKNIHDSFSFNDNWRQIIDFSNQFSFSHPTKFEAIKEKTPESLKIYLSDKQSNVNFFSAFIFSNKNIDEAINILKITNERLDTKEDFSFHGISNTVKALFVNLTNGKKQAYIITSQNNNSYAFSGENTESAYPRSKYHNDYVKDILEGIEFFSISGTYHPYMVFRDVRDNHANQKAINHLANAKIIEGYADKTFGPDREINRAELTKMVVGSVYKGDLSKYKNCFPDVKEEWFAKYICLAKDKNWVQGYKDGKFKPENNINRAEAMKIIYEVLVDTALENMNEELNSERPLDINESDWYYKYFVYFKNRNILDLQHIKKNEDLTYDFLPSANITRKEVAETISGLELF